MSIFVRTLTSLNEDKKFYSYPKNNDIKKFDYLFVFDTETTIDEYQNLKIGYFKIYVRGQLFQDGFFYDDLNSNELEIVTKYSDKTNIPLMTKNDFIKDIFYL